MGITLPKDPPAIPVVFLILLLVCFTQRHTSPPFPATKACKEGKTNSAESSEVNHTKNTVNSQTKRRFILALVTHISSLHKLSPPQLA